MISFAQNCEDVILSRVLTEASGFYVDVGACHPTIDSVTRTFYDRGWSGINIEPMTNLWKLLEERRERDINLNIALGDTSGAQTFYECPTNLPLSTLSAEVAEDLQRDGAQVIEREIQARRLDDVLEEHCKGTIDFLKVDVEGHEASVLRGSDWASWRPRIVVVEATRPRTQESDHQKWEATLTDSDYHFAQFDGLNRYYVRDEDRTLVERLSFPVSVFDKFVSYRQLVQIEWIRGRFKGVMAADDPEVSAKHLDGFLGRLVEDTQLLIQSPGLLSGAFSEYIAEQTK